MVRQVVVRHQFHGCLGVVGRIQDQMDDGNLFGTGLVVADSQSIGVDWRACAVANDAVLGDVFADGKSLVI